MLMLPWTHLLLRDSSLSTLGYLQAAARGEKQLVACGCQIEYLRSPIC